MSAITQTDGRMHPPDQQVRRSWEVNDSSTQAINLRHSQFLQACNEAVREDEGFLGSFAQGTEVAPCNKRATGMAGGKHGRGNDVKGSGGGGGRANSGPNYWTS